MGAGPIAFSYSTWVARYPEFSGVVPALATLYFAEACLYVDNTGLGPISDPGTLTVILNMTTAHIAALNSPKTGDVYNSNGTEPASPLVGRIASATEGSVTVSAEMPDQPGTAAWWQQTKYGTAAYQAMLPFRVFRYFGNPRRRVFNPPIWGRNFGSW